jgi:hypothetical protein
LSYSFRVHGDIVQNESSFKPYETVKRRQVMHISLLLYVSTDYHTLEKLQTQRLLSFWAIVQDEVVITVLCPVVSILVLSFGFLVLGRWG